MKTSNKTKLHNLLEQSKLTELTPPEIIVKLIEAKSQDEIDIIYWRNVDSFEHYPFLLVLLHDVRRQIDLMNQNQCIYWGIAAYN